MKTCLQGIKLTVLFTVLLKHRKTFTWKSSIRGQSSQEGRAANVMLHVDPICKSKVTCEVYCTLGHASSYWAVGKGRKKKKRSLRYSWTEVIKTQNTALFLNSLRHKIHGFANFSFYYSYFLPFQNLQSDGSSVILCSQLALLSSRHLLKSTIFLCVFILTLLYDCFFQQVLIFTLWEIIVSCLFSSWWWLS